MAFTPAVHQRQAVPDVIDVRCDGSMRIGY
jgi:hypothetical protein